MTWRHQTDMITWHHYHLYRGSNLAWLVKLIAKGVSSLSFDDTSIVSKTKVVLSFSFSFKNVISEKLFFPSKSSFLMMMAAGNQSRGNNKKNQSQPDIWSPHTSQPDIWTANSSRASIEKWPCPVWWSQPAIWLSQKSQSVILPWARLGCHKC